MRVLVETAVVLLLLGFPLGAALLLTHPSGDDLLGTCVSWRLTEPVEVTGFPPQVVKVFPGTRVDLIERDGAAWLRACGPPQARSEVLDRLRNMGVRHGGELRTEPRWTVELWALATERSAWSALNLAWQAWLVSAAPVGFLLAGIWLIRRRDLESYRASEIGRAGTVAWGLGVGSAGLAMVWLLEHLLPGMDEQPLVRALAEAGGPSAVFLVATAVILAPLGEEVFFRGYIFRLLLWRTGRGVAYGVSAILFAAVHTHLSATPAYVLYGLLFAWSYERTRSLAVPVIAHGTVNAVAVAVLLLK